MPPSVGTAGASAGMPEGAAKNEDEEELPDGNAAGRPEEKAGEEASGKAEDRNGRTDDGSVGIAEDEVRGAPVGSAGAPHPESTDNSATAASNTASPQNNFFFIQSVCENLPPSCTEPPSQKETIRFENHPENVQKRTARRAVLFCCGSGRRRTAAVVPSGFAPAVSGQVRKVTERVALSAETAEKVRSKLRVLPSFLV